MKLISQRTVGEALTKLEKVPAYTEILTFTNVQAGTGHKLFQSLMDMPKFIVGKAPNEFTTMANVVNIPSPLSTLNGRKLCRLYQFLNNNGMYRLVPTPEDGDCAFAAFRRCTTLPFDVADVHVRRIVLKAICNNHQFFYNLFHVSIGYTYGCIRDTPEELQRKIDNNLIKAQDLREQRMPGPFSFLSYLWYMSKNSSYADIHIMMTMSMIWNLRLTVLYAESLKEVRFRHHKTISKADLVFVLCQDTEHIVSAGRYFVSASSYFVRVCGKRFFRYSKGYDFLRL